MSTRSSDSSRPFVNFLKERVESNPGISLQNLTGHLSQVPSDLRKKYGSSTRSLKAFLQQFPEVFAIRRRRKVYLLNKNPHATSSLTKSVEGFGAKTPKRDTDDDEVTCLIDTKGTVKRITNAFGFISIDSPVKSRVYFDVRAFENAEHKSLLSSGLKKGDLVIFDAELGPQDCKARFRASRVTRISVTEPSPSGRLSPHSANDGGGGDRDTISPLVKNYGVIEIVEPNYGFIKFGQNERERAFFHANDVDKSLGKAIKNLRDLFTVKTKVCFRAKPSKKPTEKVKWEATEVLPCPSSDPSGAADFEEKLGKEVFLSDDESNNRELLEAKLDERKSREANLNESPVGHADWVPRSCSSVKGKKSARLLSEGESRQQLSGERGFFFPDTESVGTIKFGPDRVLTASVAVEMMYRDEERIHNPLSELAEDQKVSFDAVPVEGDKWMASLGWIGQGPAKPLDGNSEASSTGISNKSKDAQKPLRNDKPRRSGDSRGEETFQNGPLGSQPFQPAVTSTPKHKRYPGSHKASSTCVGAVANILLRFADEDDEVRRRFAKMVDEEVIAEKKRMRRALRDVGVQTDDEAP